MPSNVLHRIRIARLRSLNILNTKLAKYNNVSKHFHVLHATRLRNICLAREDSLLHARHVFALARDSLRAPDPERNVVHNALPRVVSLAVLLDECVVLFFLDHVVRAPLFDLAVTGLLPSLKIGLCL